LWLDLLSLFNGLILPSIVNGERRVFQWHLVALRAIYKQKTKTEEL
jgi:hypothetical protein